MKTKSIIYTLLCGIILFSCSKDDDNGGAEPEPENRAPEDFELVSAPDGATDVDLRPLLTWEETEDPDGDEVSYSLFLGKNPNSLTEIAGDISGNGFSLEDNLDLTTDYLWYVLASDGNGGETQSETFSFTTRKLKDAIRTTPSAGFVGKTEIHATAFDGKLWAIGGNDSGNIISKEVWHTMDGVTWDQATDLPYTVYYHDVVAYDGKIWVLCGNDGSTPISKVLSSTDGQNWNSVNGTLPARHDHTALVFDDKMWIIGGHNGSNYLNDVYYSTDGQNWTQVTANAAFSPRRGHSSVIFDGKMWVIGGQDANGYLNDVWYSSDGVTWTQAMQSSPGIFAARGQHISLVYGGKMFVIAGTEGGGSDFNDVWASTDGEFWTEVYPSAAFDPRRYSEGAVYEDKIWILGGYTNDHADDIWYME